MKLRATLMFIAGLSLCAGRCLAEDPSGEIRWLRQKVQELEEKVRALENAGKTAPPTNALPAISDLEKKVTALEEQRDLDANAARTQARVAPLISFGGD